MQVLIFSCLVLLVIFASVICLHPTKLTVALSLTRNVLPTDHIALFSTISFITNMKFNSMAQSVKGL